MSTKPDQIDLNADAVSVDRETVGQLPVIGVSVAETLTECIDSDLLGDKVRIGESAEVICDLNMSSEGVERKVESENLDRGVKATAGQLVCDLNVGGDDVNMSSEDIEREADVLDKVMDVETENEALDSGVDVNTGETVSRFGNEFSNENGVAVQVAERASGEIEMGQDLNVGLVREELEQGTNVMVNSSLIDGDTGQLLPHESGHVAERASGDAEVDQDKNAGLVREELEPGGNVMMNLCSFDGDRSQPLPDRSAQGAERAFGEIEMDRKVDVSLVGEVLEGGISDDVEKQAMELDTQVETSENQLVDVNVSEVTSDSDDLNELCTVNLVVDLNPSMSTDRQVSGNVNTELVSSKPEFCASDLVWGKVRSHPWWPGQIFDPSDAVQKALKYFKKDSYLIAYFGDQTFAWNEVSKVKHFREHFAQMEKQSNLEDFHYAIDCALEEVSRRMEYGLSCSCIPKEAFAKIKSQIIVNAGIKEESSLREGGDRFSDAVSFDPIELCEKIKTLAQLPYSDRIDRLEFVTVKAQLSAFYHWKGYLLMPEFNMIGGLLDSDAEIPLTVEVVHSAEVTQNVAPHLKHNEQVSPEIGKLKSQDGSSHKRKHTSGDNIHSSKKEKTLSDLLAERHTKMSDGKGSKLLSSSSGKKRKVAISISDDLAVKYKKFDSDSDDVAVKHKKLDSISDVVAGKKSDTLAVDHGRSDLSIRSANKCLPIKDTFGVGSSILKVASQLNGTNLLFKCGDGAAEKKADKNKIEERSPSRKSQSKKLFRAEESSPEELLSQLCLAAQDPMKGYNFSISLVSFLSEFRNSVSLDKQSQVEGYGDKTGKTLTKSETSELDCKNDFYWTSRVVESTAEEQQSLGIKSEGGEVLHESPSKKDIPVQSADSIGRCHNADPSPTALILNFTDSDSVPSKENLNKIFSRFGSLNELETEILKSKRAKVVFKRRADAETAFSSAGKYSIFGPSLVSYCLRYMSSSPSKASSNATKRSRKAATSEE